MNRLTARVVAPLLIAGLIPVSVSGAGFSQEKPREKVEKVQKKSDKKIEKKGDKKKSKKRARKKVKKALASAGITTVLARRFARDKKVKKTKDVPPGVRKNLRRGKPMPAGLETREVPKALRDELPVHEGHEWRIAGSDLILVSRDDQIVADVLEDVFE